MFLKLKKDVRAFPGRKIGIRGENGHIDYDSQVMITHRGVEVIDELAKEILKQNANLVVKGENPEKARKKSGRLKSPIKVDYKNMPRQELIGLAKKAGHKNPAIAKTVDLIALLEG